MNATPKEKVIIHTQCIRCGKPGADMTATNTGQSNIQYMVCYKCIDAPDYSFVRTERE